MTYIITDKAIDRQTYCMRHNISIAKLVDSAASLADVKGKNGDLLIVMSGWRNTNMKESKLNALIKRFREMGAEVRLEP